jgi:glycosyltransferase involved in cell wall biosynthesis
MKISLIQPTRNNLKYLKWAYDAIRKNQGEHTVEICVADDASTDGTWAWCQEMMRNDLHFRAIRNEGPTRVGHTILYDRLVNEVASHDICMIYHADMYLCPGALDEIEKNIGSKKIVSLTRIEPPLHPPGPEKILLDCGTEPERFDEHYLLNFLDGIIGKSDYLKYTSGIFAPWAFMKSDFQEIGGHDPLYAPQSKEDSDIFNRFQLNGVEFIQTWQGFVYHMTCRGSRFNPTLTTPGQNSSEWEAQNQRSTRNFIRKWGHFVKHDTYMKPIIPPKYNIGFIIHNCTDQLLNVLEPWCTDVYVDISPDQYIWNEQPNTKFDLLTRIHDMSLRSENDVVVTIDGGKFTNDDFYIIQELSSIIQQTNDTGEFGISNLNININSLATYENDLITCQNNIYNK